MQNQNLEISLDQLKPIAVGRNGFDHWLLIPKEFETKPEDDREIYYGYDGCDIFYPRHLQVWCKFGDYRWLKKSDLKKWEEMRKA
jgi:hypothetical protein